MRIPRIENWVPRIREIGSLQIHIGYLTFSLKKLVCLCKESKKYCRKINDEKGGDKQKNQRT